MFVASTTNAFATDQNDSWRGSVRTKLQTDNRYDMDNGDYTGEVWGTLVYNNPNQKLNAHISAISRLSSDIYRDKQQMYQAYAEKQFDFLPVTLRGGRFEKSDNLGLYLVDGASIKYQFSNPLSFEVYGGRPLQIDHVQSLRGNLVGGIESALNLTPNFSMSWFKVEKTDFRLGMQAVQRSETFLQNVVRTTTSNSNTTYSSEINPEFSLLTPIFNEGLIDGNFDVPDTPPPVLEATTDIDNQTNSDVLGMPSQVLRKRNLTTYRYNAATRLTGNLLGENKPFEMYLKGSYASEKIVLKMYLLMRGGMF